MDCRKSVETIFDAVEVYVSPTRISDRIAIGVELTGVCDPWTIVGEIRHSIAIEIVGASITYSIRIAVDLQGIGHLGTIVECVQNPVPIVISSACRLGLINAASRIRYERARITTISQIIAVGVVLIGI